MHRKSFEQGKNILVQCVWGNSKLTSDSAKKEKDTPSVISIHSLSSMSNGG